MARVCPDCELDLKHQTFRNVTVDVCPRCAGIFFDEGEVNKLRIDGNDAMGELEEMVRPSEDFIVDFRTMTEVSRRCPGCKTSMDKMRYLYSSPIMLDSCPNCCGVWVEDGELRRMQDVLTAEGTKLGSKVRANIASADSTVKPDANASRVKRLERAMRLFGRRA